MGISLNAIYIIWLREMKKFIRNRSRLVGSLAMPFFFLAFLVLLILLVASADWSHRPPSQWVSALGAVLVILADLFATFWTERHLFKPYLD